ncbi:uncharacterized protein LOC110105132 [Dendrobium catenatum]|uniref:Uncharacterized protein n=1 Tax=Dendrobium catenatum TaxID=906689 RepID=A0A2I0X659_9ASPA|nr:uncharacterized protein LOC110105132 [Dendrobium catenatum]PKU83394.1 hypothetical protein MA16_Dca016503 [Dendrobium catenatum]
MDVSAHDVFWSAPSKKEAMEAVSDLQMISSPTNGQSSSGLVRSHPGRPFPELSLLLSQTHHTIVDALHLLWTNPTFKNMVISLATDKAVWNAIMKNKMVQEFKSTYHPEKYLKHVELPPPSSQAQWSDAAPNLFAQILSFLCRIAKAVVMKFIDDIISLVNKLFDQHMSEFTTEIASELVKYAFMLSVLVFIIVILKRSMTSSA